MTGPVPATADAVVVGGGTVGAWCAWFLRRGGLERVMVLEQDRLGQGASSRAAGLVRGQGGTPAAVLLGIWTRAFYRGQAAELGTDSGFVEQGYYLPAFTAAQVVDARARMAMQRGLGLEVEWMDAEEAERRNPTLAPGSTLGGTYASGDGYLHPPRNVAAYTVALGRAGVHVAERTAFTGLDRPGPAGGAWTVQTAAGPISTPRVVLTGGAGLADVGRLAGIRILAGGVRHQVAVTQPHPDLAPGRLPMVFDVAAGLYWRPEDGGMLFGMSNPDEPPGPGEQVDWAYLETMRARLAQLVPVTGDLGLRRVWAATIDYTPDHLPILGPGIDADGPMHGVTVASAAGHGMMWGPAVSRVAADLALGAPSSVLDPAELGLDRFDEQGNSRLAADPIALPFPERTSQPAAG
jgi:sarcosine oxidase, subunit beta